MNRPPSTAEIISRVSGAFCVSLDELFGNGRHANVVIARSACSAMFREMTNMSFPEIAVAMCRPNHSSILTAERRWRERDVNDPVNAARYNLAKAAIMATVAMTPGRSEYAVVHRSGTF